MFSRLYNFLLQIVDQQTFVCLIFLGSEKLLDKFGEREDLPDPNCRIHRDEIVQVVAGLGCRDRRVGRRSLHPRPVRFLHVPPIRGEGGEKERGRDDPEKSVIFRI